MPPDLVESHDLWQRRLSGLVGKRIKLFLLNGKAYTGQLIECDADTVVVGPEDPETSKNVSTISASQISVFRKAERGE